MSETNDKPETPVPSDSIKLGIRDEVEHRFDSPPASFVLRIESEVEARVEHRVKQYKTLAAVIIAVLGVSFALLYRQTLAEARSQAVRALAEQEVIKAKNRILEGAAAIDDQRKRVTTMTEDTQQKYNGFIERLEEIKKQDRVVLLDKDGLLRLHSPVYLNAPIFFETDNSFIKFTKGGSIICGEATNGPTSLQFLPDGQIEILYPNGTNWVRFILNQRY
ncbi:MAG: hypothetical protein ABSC38_08035 [Verrucomicrobiia bacterium]